MNSGFASLSANRPRAPASSALDYDYDYDYDYDHDHCLPLPLNHPARQTAFSTTLLRPATPSLSNSNTQCAFPGGAKVVGTKAEVQRG